MNVVGRIGTFFGIDAIRETGRNAYIIILSRALRMIAHGANSLILGLFLSELKFADYQIGLFLTFTLLGDVFLGGFLTLIADRVGRRKVLLAGSLAMIMSGLVFSQIENFWILLLAAVFGVVSATGGDFGPFRSIEESILSDLTTPATRGYVLSMYVTLSTFGSALGSEASGRIVHFLQTRNGWSLADAYHALFWSYVMSGIVNVILVLLLTADCEISQEDKDYAQISQTETIDPEPTNAEPLNSATQPVVALPWYRRLLTSLRNNLSSISVPTRRVMYKLWFLLSIDSLADGMVPYTLTNYYVDEKFHPAKSTLGDATGAAYMLGALSTVFAGPLTKIFGIINTMVFTHVPSSAAVLLFPAPTSLWVTIVLLCVRAGLNNLDQAPRSALIAAIVKPGERTSVLGITSMIRTLAAMSGPTVTGILAGSNRFWIAFVVAGVCRLAYDFGLYVLFINIVLYQNEAPGPTSDPTGARRLSDEEGMTELHELTRSDDDDDEEFDDAVKGKPGSGSDDSVGSSSIS